MNLLEIKNVLLNEFEYSEFSAERTAKRMQNMDSECLAAFERWVNTKEIPQLICGKYTITNLIEEYQLKLPAAILTISDLKSNYEYVSGILEKGNK